MEGKPHRVKGRVWQSGVNYPGKPFFVLHPSFLLKAVICLFRGQMMLFHIWLQIMFMKEEVCGHVGKGNPGAVIGVTDDGYPIVTEDYSCPYFTGTSRSMPAVRECWYCRHADFRKSTKPDIRSSICRRMENRVDTRFGFMKNEE
ncbi:MAG: hypothetical protein ACLTDI_12600 [Acutalibacteraceae bacterium]